MTPSPGTSGKTGPSGKTGTVAPKGESRALRSVLDLLVYAPLGFAMSAGTLVPELAKKGRARAEEQVRLARAIGQFAVPIARRKGKQAIREQVARTTERAPRHATRGPALPRPAPPDAAPTSAPDVLDAGAMTAGDDKLPIEGYDALPASSIVTLLDGLRPAQLRAIDGYERANRSRRTVLTRVAQLLA